METFKKLDDKKVIKILFFVPFLLYLGFLYKGLFVHGFPYVLKNYIKISLSPTLLFTDFLQSGSVGSAMLNAAINGTFSLLLAYKCKSEVNGYFFAAFFTTVGFSFLGVSLYSSLPIFLGAILYAKIKCIPYSNILGVALFSIGLSPVVSQISFQGFLPLYAAIPLGIVVGLLLGFMLPPFAFNTKKFHKGYNLYNTGFAIGTLGTFVSSFLRSFNLTVEPVYILYETHKPFITGFLIISCVYFIVVGLLIDKNAIKNNFKLQSYSGVPDTDFTKVEGYGSTFFNMGILGLISILFVVVLGGYLNGPAIAGIFSVVGFAAYGKNAKNILPIMLGVIIAGVATKTPLASSTIIASALFATALSPITGEFGLLAGFIAGFMHLTLTKNTVFIHGGLNLFNNGFSAGLIAVMMLPILETLRDYRLKKREGNKKTV